MKEIAHALKMAKLKLESPHETSNQGDGQSFLSLGPSGEGQMVRGPHPTSLQFQRGKQMSRPVEHISNQNFELPSTSSVPAGEPGHGCSDVDCSGLRDQHARVRGTISCFCAHHVMHVWCCQYLKGLGKGVMRHRQNLAR